MFHRLSPLVYGYPIATDADGLFGPGDRIVGIPVRFRPMGAAIARGGWIWSGIWARNNQRYRHITDTGRFYLGSDGRTYFIPDTYRPAAAGGFVTNVTQQTGTAPLSDDLTNTDANPQALWAWMSGKRQQSRPAPEIDRPATAKPAPHAQTAPPNQTAPKAEPPCAPEPLWVETRAPGHDVVHNFIAPTRQSDGTYSGGDRLDLTDLQQDSPVPITTATIKISKDAKGHATLVFPNSDRLTLRGVPCALTVDVGFLAAIGVPRAVNRRRPQHDRAA